MSPLFPVLTISRSSTSLFFALNLSFPPHCSPVSVTPESSAQDSRTPSVSWSEITPGHKCVACNLPQIPSELLACCAPHCVSHTELLDQLCYSFLASLQQASAQCLPHVRKRKAFVPDWNVSACQQAKAVCQILVLYVSGWTVAVLPQVLFIKSSKKPRIDISMWFVVWGIGNCISLVTGLALLCLMLVTETSCWEGTLVAAIAITLPLMVCLPMMTLLELSHLNLNSH